ncbi:histidine kinase [Fibrisoma limi BUZ 3]|uniref:histidine kinase n=1 Tax=Fibrisoma limi BUZ 3 TaxID=1185876 RepID=I2GGM4_9BACT|nr:ATP-binding protein [Fibrisoma limi]CCH53049.1 histidine kinase [Fibrisoma limi BUZ 3]
MMLLFRFLLLSPLLVGSVLTGPPLKAQQFMLPPAERTLTQPPGINLFSAFMTQDNRGNLWLSSSNGVIRYDGRQLRVFHAPGHPQDDALGRVTTDSRGRVWLRYSFGNDESKLAYFDPQTQQIQFISDTTRLVREFLAKDGIRTLFVDRHDHLWIGRIQTGLLRVDPRTLSVEPFLLDKTEVNSIDQSSDGMLWAGTSTGVYSVNPVSRQVRRYFDKDGPLRIQADNPITALRVRSSGELVLGLYNKVAVVNPSSGEIRQVDLPLPTPTSRLWTNKIVVDSQKNAYFSVGTLVFRMNPQNQLQRLEFAYPAEKVISIWVSQGQRLGNNRLWVNAGQQLYAYDLGRLRAVPPLNILDVSINGTRLVQNEKQREERFRRDTSGQASIYLKEGDFLSLRFLPQVGVVSSNYRYKLDGHDSQWAVYSDTYGHATYQLRAGTYSFALNRARPMGGWDPQVAYIRIQVEPPFWRTAWFLSLTILVLGVTGFWLIRSWNRRRRLRQELARREFEAETLRKMDIMKSNFFANITHEFRTPLTIILNATEQLVDTPLNATQQQQTDAIQRHAHQLLRLITETLDMSRLDAGKLDAHPQLGDPVAFIRQVAAQFDGLAGQRGITLTWEGDPGTDELVYSFDDDKWEKIAYNLLSNALKFTPEGGQVNVSGRIVAPDRFVLRVADTGIGIPAQQLTHIFDRFYQVDSGSTRAYSGTGIGLALVKELTDWLGGRVTVESDEGKGSVFTVELPITNPYAQQLNETDTTSDSDRDNPQRQAAPVSQSAPETAQRQTVPLGTAARNRPLPAKNSDTSIGEKPLLLLVEDNSDLRMQMATYLSKQYRIATAATGREGLEMAIAEIPDLIVSDVMMPEMDGYELTRTLKADDRTSHIPIVLLTARSSPDSRLVGLQAGADNYLGKPFSLAELNLRLGNALRTRQQWQQRFTEQAVSALKATSSTPASDREERFINTLRQHILSNLHEVDRMDVDWLAEQAGMSRTQLHRKLTALTSLTPNRFIHRVRLDRAAELLQSGEFNVAQVAYELGYSSQSYFAKLFQEQFGYSPKALKV